MQPPLHPGTFLQNRYTVLKLIGQGGFGRTYLAEDQGRFKERCVLKEFIPTGEDDYAHQKSQELFQREAQTLYQLQHPQVPQFRATFEENQRLFLVQDYIEGETYRSIVETRMAQGKSFTEAEAIHFLEQMLPVLSYIHSKGIIHRDISPENVILRTQDHLPVLIDFGIVKDLANQVQQGIVGDIGKATTVGKLGYAPSEQLQAGKAYPSSDLYALAVTTVVMLTGRRSQDLIDEETMTWRWHQWLPSLSSRLAQVLNRMLSSKPQNRFQSATEVAQALRSLTGLIPPANAPDSSRAESTEVTSILPPALNPQSASSVAQSSRPAAPAPSVLISSGSTTPAFQRPAWLVPAICSGAMLVGILILWPFLPPLTSPSDIARRPPRSPIAATPDTSPNSPDPSLVPPPVTSPTPTAAATNDPTVTNPSTPSPTPTAQIDSVPMTFAADGGRLQTNGRVDKTHVKRYILNPSQGQTIAARVLDGSVTLHIRDPQGNSLKQGVLSWQSSLQMANQSYQIDVESSHKADYILELSMSAPASGAGN